MIGLVESMIELLMIIVILLMLRIYAKSLKTKIDYFNIATCLLLCARVAIVITYSIYDMLNKENNFCEWITFSVIMFFIS